MLYFPVSPCAPGTKNESRIRRTSQERAPAREPQPCCPPQHIRSSLHLAGLRADELAIRRGQMPSDGRLPMSLRKDTVAGDHAMLNHRCGGSVGIDPYDRIAPTSRFTPKTNVVGAPRAFKVAPHYTRGPSLSTGHLKGNAPTGGAGHAAPPRRLIGNKKAAFECLQLTQGIVEQIAQALHREHVAHRPRHQRAVLKHQNRVVAKPCA